MEMCGSSIITYKREVTNWAPLLVKVYMYLLTFYLLVLLFIILSKIEATQPSFLLTINKVFLYCIVLLQGSIQTWRRTKRSRSTSCLFWYRPCRLKQARIFCPPCSVVWNRLPFSVRHAQTMTSFKSQLKTTTSPSMLKCWVGLSVSISHSISVFVRLFVCPYVCAFVCMYKVLVGRDNFGSDLELWVYIRPYKLFM